MEELAAKILKLKVQWARIFTQSIKEKGKGRTKNVYVIPDTKAIFEPDGFLTMSNVLFAKFQDLGTGTPQAAGNPFKDKMYKELDKSKRSRFGMPRSRRFSKGNKGGIRASFYQTIPMSLYNRYLKQYDKVLFDSTEEDINKTFPS